MRHHLASHGDATCTSAKRLAPWTATVSKSCSTVRSGNPIAARAQLAENNISWNRRAALIHLSAAGSLLVCPPGFCKAPSSSHLGAYISNNSADHCWAQLSSLPPGTAYARQGPLIPLELPKLEHTCTSCFPACVGDKCLLSIEVTYPKGGSLLGLSPPYPLAIFSGGFTVSCSAYKSTAARLASWGYTVVRYNTRDALPDVLDDVTCVKLLRELIDWAATHPLMRRLADTRRVYATGHSRGAKLAALTAAVDPRVAALCLMDPVDVTQYAPLSDRFPSAAAALSAVAQSGRFLPVAVVGSGQAGDCAPRFNNYRSFFQAAPSAAWEVLLPAAGHFQYLDSSTALQRAVCGGAVGGPDDATVRRISQAALVAWGEAMVKLPGADMLSCLEARCSSLGEQARGDTSNSMDDRSESRRFSNSSVSNSSSADGWLPPPADVPLAALRAQQQQQQQQRVAGRSGYGVEQYDENSSGVQADLQQQLQPLQQPSQSIRTANHTQEGLRQSHSQTFSKVEIQQTAQAAALPLNGTTLQLQQQQLQASLGALPRVQTRQEVWSSGHVPSPVRLKQLQADLERLLVAVSYQTAATVEVCSQFRNFG